MALAELVATLEAEGESRIAALLAEARADAERVRAAAATELAQRRQEAVHRRELEERFAAARAIEAARRQGAARRLEARAAALERVRCRATAMLAEQAASPQVIALLAADLEQAIGYLGPVPALVDGSPDLCRLLRARSAGPDVTFMPLESAAPGLVVRAADGSVTIDATLERRLARSWPELAIDLARELEEVA